MIYVTAIEIFRLFREHVQSRVDIVLFEQLNLLTELSFLPVLLFSFQ